MFGHLAELEGDFPEKSGIICEVPPPEASWVLHQPMRPLEASLFHPFRRIAEDARMKVESGADSHHDLGIEPPHILRHETFLFGCAEPDP